jgi:hypothetical protein
MERMKWVGRWGLLVVLSLGLAWTSAAAGDWTDAESVSAAREQLADLMASDQLDRIDFRAETFDGAMDLVYRAADAALERCRQDLRDPAETARVAGVVLDVFNSHTSRGLATTLMDSKEFPITNPDDATALGDMVGIATLLVREYAGPDASPERIQTAATNLFTTVVIDPDGGLSYLRQYLEHVQHVADLPIDERARFLEER